MDSNQQRDFSGFDAHTTFMLATEALKDGDYLDAVELGGSVCVYETCRITSGESSNLDELDKVSSFLMRIIIRFGRAPIAHGPFIRAVFEESVEALDKNKSIKNPLVQRARATLLCHCAKCCEILWDEESESEYADQAICTIRQLRIRDRLKYRIRWNELLFIKCRTLYIEDEDVAAYKLCKKTYWSAWRGRLAFSYDDRERCRSVMEKCCELMGILTTEQNKPLCYKLWHFRAAKHEFFGFHREMVTLAIEDIFDMIKEGIDKVLSWFRNSA